MNANDMCYRARIVSSAALAGAAASGIVLHTVQIPFDSHIPGAVAGAMIAILNWTRIART